MSYRCTCHCGRFVFEVLVEERSEVQGGVQGAAERPGQRNAGTHRGCGPRSGTLVSVPRDRLRLLSSEEGVGAYTFSGRIIGHRFCGACGTHLYGEALDGAGPGIAYVNPGCISLAERAATSDADDGATGIDRLQTVEAG